MLIRPRFARSRTRMCRSTLDDALAFPVDKEDTGSSRLGVRQACGCWTGTYYTSGNDAYPPPLRPVTHAHAHVPKHAR